MAFTPTHGVTDMKFSGATSISMASSFTSDVYPLSHETLYAIQAVFTGSGSGELVLEYSLDQENWCEVSGTNRTVSGDGTYIWDGVGTAVPYFRLSYNRTSGTGTMTAKLLIKFNK